MNKGQQALILDSCGNKISNFSPYDLSPFPEDLEVKVSEISEKAGYLLEKREYEKLLGFIEERIPKVICE